MKGIFRIFLKKVMSFVNDMLYVYICMIMWMLYICNKVLFLCKFLFYKECLVIRVIEIFVD